VCDGARKLDDVGFNGCDSGYFKAWLAAEADGGIKSDSIIIEMYQKLLKYRNQLSRFNISYETLKPEFDKTELKVDPSWNSFKMPFGKHKDKSFAQLAREEFSYLEWIAKDFNDPEIKAAARAVIEGQPIKPKVKVSTNQQKAASGVRCWLENGEDIVISFSYDAKLVERVKSLSFRMFDGDKKRWMTKLNMIDELTEKFPRAEYSQELKEIIEKRKQLKSISNAMDTETEFELGNFGKGKKMLPFQKAGLEFINLADGKAILADEMGIGKTIQGMSYLRLHPELRPAIVCCPASIKFNWNNELKNWMDTQENVYVIEKGLGAKLTKKEGNPIEKIKEASIIIINYDIIGKWEQELLKIKPKAIIFDEGHVLKNPKANRTIVSTRIAHSLPHRIISTGTPVLNRPKELFSLLHIVRPDLYPEISFFGYAKKYCDAQQISIGYNKTAWDFSGASNIPQLADESKALMIRRTKKQVLTELPEKRRSSVIFRLDNVKEYESQKQAFKRWLIEEKGQSADSTTVLSQIEYMKQMSTKGKMKSALEWLDNSFIETGEKVVVFATHKETIGALMDHFGDIAVKIDGETSQKDRERAVTEFQNNPNILVFVGNIQAAGVGITLTAACNVVFLEFAWVPGLHDQAEDRIYRIGQKNACNAYYLLAENSIDEMIMNMLERKREVTQGIMSDQKELNFNLLDELKKYL
jgi:SWI/SNF-related matrix-associated actin-dependent regulator 1 of chromatin subfamily A